MHPADEIRGIKSKRLSKKKIILGVTGSISAVECVKLARELIRNGAEVIPVMTKSATKIIHPDSIEFATGNKPIIELSGAAEHVTYCGNVKKPADLLLISPCTANTISKIAHGIDDTSVTTFATTAIGSKIPVMIVPAMHLSMYDHKIVQKNIEICKKIGIKIVEPILSSNKAKMANIDEIVAFSTKLVGKKDLVGRKILIIGGSTAESIDDVRVVTSRSSGKTAYHLALNAFYHGAEVEVWYGWNKKEIPNFINTNNFESIDDLNKLITKNKNQLKEYDSIILCAAIADYSIKKTNGKVSSGLDKLVLEMQPTMKIIGLLRKLAPNSKIVGFKVEDKKDKLKARAMDLLKKNDLDLVIGNTISGFSCDKNDIMIITKDGKTDFKNGKKEELTDYILSYIV